MTRKDLIPPQALINLVGGGDFVAIGAAFLRLYITVGGLYPEARVLDLGCGCGRMALPFSRYLSTGSYHGFDIHAGAIAWCREHITVEHPNFQFDHIDAYNSSYNPRGIVRTETYRFPYPDDFFDFAFASSLFTHLVWGESRNYLAETRRVVRPGGRALFTFFVLTPESERLMSEGRSKLQFPAQGDRCRLGKADDPGSSVAYPEQEIRGLFAESGLVIRDIHFGSWAGRTSGLTVHDMVVAERPLSEGDRVATERRGSKETRSDLQSWEDDPLGDEANKVTQYQSFPGAPGDSSSIQKLMNLRLPSLVGKSFLDVGCNEGFFCGYAKFNGAQRVVGLDKSGVFIERARQRFPDCEFLEQDWDHIPQGPFDVILLASSLHYADDQALLIQNLMNELAPDGTLVLELGVHPKPGSEWVKITRSIDERLFPTAKKLEEVLKPYAWKLINSSVAQPGDPIPRYVFHIRPRKPVAYLLMEPPTFGKSTISRDVFQRADIKVVSGDAIIIRVAEGTLTAPADLTAMVQRDYSPLRIDQVILNVAKAGLLNSLVRLFLQEAGGQDFSLDAFIPRHFHEEVARLISNDGYMTVKLTWDRVGEDLPSDDVLAGRADAYMISLGNQASAVSATDSAVNLPFEGTTGAVEQVAVDGGRLTVWGWALHESGEMPQLLQLSIGGRRIDIGTFEKQSRPDIQRHFGLSHALCGYVMTTTLEPGITSENLVEIQVFGGNDAQSLSGPFRKAGHLAGSH